MKKNLFSILIFVCVIAFAGCLHNVTGETPLDVNLLQNSSFSQNGSFSLQGWNISADSLVAQSSQIPVGGGVFSVAITPGTYPVEGAIYQTIPAISGTHVFQISFWGMQRNVEGETYINVLHYSPPAPPVRISGPTVFSAVWQFYTMTDTIEANTGDSIRIGCEADTAADGTNGQAFFNLCEFEQIQ